MSDTKSSKQTSSGPVSTTLDSASPYNFTADSPLASLSSYKQSSDKHDKKQQEVGSSSLSGKGDKAGDNKGKHGGGKPERKHGKVAGESQSSAISQSDAKGGFFSR